MKRKGRIFIALIFLASSFHACAHVDQAAQPSPRLSASLSRDLAEKILSLNPDALSEKDVTEVLSRCPAPRIVTLDGSLPIVTMESFAKFLVRMGYPEESVRDPKTGSYSSSSYRDSAEMAGMVAWYYEKEGMRPMVIGHSQGGMLSIKILYELAGTFHDKITLWNPEIGLPESRTTFIDPLTGQERPVVGLKLCFASAIATGKGMRILLGQWGMLSQLRRIPDTVEEFTGFHIQQDLISGTFFGVTHADQYYPIGSARVRNVVLPAGTSHIGIPLTEDLAKNLETREWIERYTPSTEPSESNEGPPGNSKNILFAADLWYSIRKHWCVELQRWIRSREKEVRVNTP